MVKYTKTGDEALGTRVKEARKRAGLTQRELADRTGLKTNYVTRVETGDRKCSDVALRAIATAVSANLAWLKTGKGSPLSETCADLTVKEIRYLSRQVKTKLDTESQRIWDKAIIALTAGEKPPR